MAFRSSRYISHAWPRFCNVTKQKTLHEILVPALVFKVVLLYHQYFSFAVGLSMSVLRLIKFVYDGTDFSLPETTITWQKDQKQPLKVSGIMLLF